VQAKRRPAEVFAIQREDIEGVELHLLVVLARVQGVVPIDPNTTASPSMTKCLSRFLSAASTIHG
jgi:hypothetical protein